MFPVKEKGEGRTIGQESRHGLKPVWSTPLKL